MLDNLNKFHLAELIKAQREELGYTQEALIKELGEGINRSNLAHLEQAIRIPPPKKLESICKKLNIPKRFWMPFMSEMSQNRLEFETLLTELVGYPVYLRDSNDSIIKVVEKLIDELFNTNFSISQAYQCLSRALVFYNIPQMSEAFFNKYITADAFKSLLALEQNIEIYQKDAIRLFSSFEEAYISLNWQETDLKEILLPLASKDDEKYRLRSEWNGTELIPDERLPFLGYIAADRVRQESAERNDLSSFLVEIASKKRQNPEDKLDYPEKTKRKYDSLLRKFNSKIEHGLFSPLFSPSPELLEREAKFIKADSDTNNLEEMEKTQIQAYKNLANYLTADFMDVYVATSMRSEADFISVNSFVKSLFNHQEIRPLKLRYFNPTQSWVEDRVAKGLVEALMLKRADFCIYMAQKDDTFGKDSEASVSLGQGKAVIVYVPKLYFANPKIDSEIIGKMNINDLLSEIKKYDEEFTKDIDDNIDKESLMGKLLLEIFKQLDDEAIANIVKNHWADYDLFGEAEGRVNSSENKTKLIIWLEEIIKKGMETKLPVEIKDDLISIFIANTIRYEKRAKIFREIHPLALQIILSTGVLNGILVTRSVNSCAKILKGLILNQLDLELVIDENNYKLIEKDTRSTIRVISRHQLLANSFSAYYRNYPVN